LKGTEAIIWSARARQRTQPRFQIKSQVPTFPRNHQSRT